MNKRWLLAFLIFCITSSAYSQTLFTYGSHSADARDFLRAFNKNNSQASANKSKAMRDYLELYINSRLKIQEAHERGYDTLPQIRSEVETLRSQIIENYMSDPVTITRLTKEAFQRSQKDIHAGHIFISFVQKGGIIDSAAAARKLKEVMGKLDKGEDFLSVAAQYSDEPGAKETHGDMGYITVLTLPYPFENILYSTAPGKIAKPFTSKIGYHILKNLDERKALGKIRIQQILIAFPPGADEATKKKAASLADSLYQRIMAGDDFAKLASMFSNDYISAATGGNVPDISVGQYDPSFEKMIWSLPDDGAVAKPFMTSHGYHIVKRVELKPVVTDEKDKANMDEIKSRIMSDDRWKTAKDFIYEHVRKKPGFKKAAYDDQVLWALSDSLLDAKPMGVNHSMNLRSPLFSIGDSTIRVQQWISYAQAFRYRPDRSGLKHYPDLMDEFSKAVMYEYYRSHLEEYNDDFRTQMSEFRDGNLFFEIMQQEVWNRTQNDSTELLAIYKKNRDKYNWKPSADAIIFFSSDEAAARTLYDELKKEPANWKKTMEPYVERIVSDSSRYEWEQIPGLGKQVPKPGMLTSPTPNTTDNTSSFAYIVKVYTETAPRSFNEAKGLVMNDYQADLEAQWIKKLRKKFPVVVNTKVLNSLVSRSK
jgi:peptidyl-prolyl cis-trans isomerase SurA